MPYQTIYLCIYRLKRGVNIFNMINMTEFCIERPAFHLMLRMKNDLLSFLEIRIILQDEGSLYGHKRPFGP